MANFAEQGLSSRVFRKFINEEEEEMGTSEIHNLVGVFHWFQLIRDPNVLTNLGPRVRPVKPSPLFPF